MGVWIETVAVNWCNNALIVTPCMGVWIETILTVVTCLLQKCHTLYGCVD